MLSAESLQKIDREVAKYPPDQKQSAVMSALIIAQDENGWLSTETMDKVAEYLGMPPVAVYEVATFYSMYNLKPLGKYKLTLCTCLPCGLQGSLAAADHLREKLGIDFNETTPDGHFTLKEGECPDQADRMVRILRARYRRRDERDDQRRERKKKEGAAHA